MLGNILSMVGYVERIAFLLTFLFLLLCIFRKFRIFAGTAIVYCSYILGIGLWVHSFFNTYSVFGIMGVIIGIFLAGVGVFVTGLISLLWIHKYSMFFGFVATGIFIFGMRYAGIYIATKEEERRYMESSVIDEEEFQSI